VEGEPRREDAPQQGATRPRDAAILVDTDVLVDHLRGARPLRLPHPRLRISVVTRCELFAGSRAGEAGLRSLLDVFEEIAIDRAIAERGGRIRRNAGIPLPDALIAATALEHGLGIMTRNRRHLERVTGVDLRSPEPA
jgi:toxin FitB